MTQGLAMELKEVWELGYSIAELWGSSRPVSRGTSAVSADHGMLWGILSIAEYQIDKGAGHRYLRERLWRGDWIAIGYLESDVAKSGLVEVPKIQNAQFGKRSSAVGDGINNYVDVRIVNAELVA